MLALLHTSPVHVPVFDALRDLHHPGLALRHSVAEDLLARARAEGPEAVAGEVADALRDAVAQGARAVLCTCSTIGAVAEAADLPVPVLRVDRPMAAAAVRAAHAGAPSTPPRVVVVAALAGTLGPTVELVADEARRAGRPCAIDTVLVEGAWERFEAGDPEGYAAVVAEAVDAVRDAAAVVLAQASMAPAQDLTRTALPVLSSPRPGLAAAAAAAAAVAEADV